MCASLITSPRTVGFSRRCLSWHRFLSRNLRYHRSSLECWVVGANKGHVVCMQWWRRYSSHITDCCGCSSVAAIKMNGSNQCNIYGDDWHVALKITSVAFKYKLCCTMWIAHAKSYLKGTAWKHSSRKEMRMSSFILALNELFIDLLQKHWNIQQMVLFHFIWKCWYLPSWLICVCISLSQWYE